MFEKNEHSLKNLNTEFLSYMTEDFPILYTQELKARAQTNAWYKLRIYNVVYSGQKVETTHVSADR